MAPALAFAANFVADFGEFIAVAPAMLAVAVFLALARQRALAATWCAGLAALTALVALLKAAALPVSGHAAVAMGFEGGLAVLLWRDVFGLGGGTRGLAAAAAALGVCVVAAVYALHWHTRADLASGCAIGLAACGLLGVTPLRQERQRRGTGGAALGVVALLVASLHGVRLDGAREHRAAVAFARATDHALAALERRGGPG